MATPSRIRLSEKLARISKPWNPKIIAELNGQHVKLVKLSGEFEWHHHDDEDELFFVVSGSMTMQFRDRDEALVAGDMIVIPRGVEHCPLATPEAEVVLFEPASTRNTGTHTSDRSVDDLERI